MCGFHGRSSSVESEGAAFETRCDQFSGREREGERGDLANMGLCYSSVMPLGGQPRLARKYVDITSCRKISTHILYMYLTLLTNCYTFFSQNCAC